MIGDLFLDDGHRMRPSRDWLGRFVVMLSSFSILGRCGKIHEVSDIGISRVEDEENLYEIFSFVRFTFWEAASWI